MLFLPYHKPSESADRNVAWHASNRSMKSSITIHVSPAKLREQSADGTHSKPTTGVTDITEPAPASSANLHRPTCRAFTMSTELRPPLFSISYHSLNPADARIAPTEQKPAGLTVSNCHSRQHRPARRQGNFLCHLMRTSGRGDKEETTQMSSPEF